MFAMFVVIAAVAYLLGSINFAVIVSQRRHHDDIRNHGSKNAGTTNMMRTYGNVSAALTLGGDMAKGIVACIIGGLLMGQEGAAVAALFCVLGHVFPIFFEFRGGKGVAVAAATILYINPVVFLLVVLVFVGVVWFTKYLSLGSIIAAAIYPVFLFSFTLPAYRGWVNILAVMVSAVIIILHHANIARLWNGTEHKFAFKKSVQTTKPPLADEATDDE